MKELEEEKSKNNFKMNTKTSTHGTSSQLFITTPLLQKKSKSQKRLFSKSKRKKERNKDRNCNLKKIKRFYNKTKTGKKIQQTQGVVEELYKVVGKKHKALYEKAKASKGIDCHFIALVIKSQEVLGFEGRSVDGKIGSKTMRKWDKWKTGGKHGIDYNRLFQDKKLEIGIALGYDKGGLIEESSRLVLSVLDDAKYGLILISSSTSDKYIGSREYRVQGDNTAPMVKIQLIIDVTNAKKVNPKKTFSSFLTDKEITIYMGHARYGTGPDFDEKKSPSENFIIGVNSALHKANKLKRGYDTTMNSYLKDRKNDLEELSKAGKFTKETYQIWFLNACSTINYLDEIRGGLVRDRRGTKKSQNNLRLFGTRKSIGPGSEAVLIRGLLEMKTMDEIIKLANAEQSSPNKRHSQKNYYFSD